MPNLPFTLSVALTAACATAFALPPPATAVAVDASILRAQGPAALDALLAKFDKLPPGDERDALAVQIDQVAAQRYATISRLYWYTDLEAAKAAAAAAGKPILELRLLGRLDEELSCANSRIFRETLYANAQVSKYLRAHFILLWTTERPVPKVTIDFGDGRTIHTTTTGNSAHFIRDQRGDIVDLLPGVYAPAPFKAELARSIEMIASLDKASAAKRAEQIRAYHAKAAAQTRDKWRTLGSSTTGQQIAALLTDKAKLTAVAFAQYQTVSKAYVERPQLALFGPDPGSIDESETAAWARIGELTWPVKGGVLDKPSKTLVIALHQAGPVKASSDQLGEIIPRFEQHLVADSALNEFKLRTKVHDYFAAKDKIEFAPLDTWLYADVFGTPITDRWLGLLPRTDITGLPGDGATAP